MGLGCSYKVCLLGFRGLSACAVELYGLLGGVCFDFGSRVILGGLFMGFDFGLRVNLGGLFVCGFL